MHWILHKSFAIKKTLKTKKCVSKFKCRYNFFEMHLKIAMHSRERAAVVLGRDLHQGFAACALLFKHL